MDSLDFVIACTDLRGRSSEAVIGIHVQDISEELGVEINPILEDDIVMTTPDEIPQGAIVYAHGDTTNGYAGVGRARELAQERPDVKIILGMGRRVRPYFENPADTEFLNAAYDAGFDASKQVIADTERTPWPFIVGKADYGSINNCLKNYARQLMEMRQDG